MNKYKFDGHLIQQLIKNAILNFIIGSDHHSDLLMDIETITAYATLYRTEQFWHD